MGLPGRALQKLKELQVQQERLNRERQQKQLQLDSTQTSLNKQTVKYEEVRGELQCVQRELQVAREEVQAGVCVRERLSQDLQVKQAQVCSLEGQLGSARTLTHTLEKEVKRLEADLEKLQNTSSSGESMLFSTPCWSMTSPRDHNAQVLRPWRLAHAHVPTTTSQGPAPPASVPPIRLLHSLGCVSVGTGRPKAFHQGTTRSSSISPSPLQQCHQTRPGCWGLWDGGGPQERDRHVRVCSRAAGAYAWPTRGDEGRV